MSSRSDISDFSALLCECCGYVLDDLDPSGDCPECGVPIEQSQPHARPGSAFQRRRGLASLIHTWFATLLHPRHTFRCLRIDEPAGIALMWRGLFLAVLLPCILYLGAIVISMWNSGSFGDLIDPFFYVSIIGVFIWIAGVVYTTLAVPRLKFIAKQRGMRQNNALAWTIVGQASIGLTLMPLCIALWLLIDMPFVLYAQFTNDFTIFDGALWVVLQVLGTVLTLGSLPIGIISFELLLWTGNRQLRYRNAHSSDRLGSQITGDTNTRPHAGPRTDIT